MAFPATPLDLDVELNLNGTWTDVTSYVQRRDDFVTISRGRADEANTVEPSSAKFTLNNRDGRFSPRNPTGVYYGTIGRNTPVRIRQGTDGTAYLEQYASTSRATAPDTAGLSITGDIDIRIDVELFDWTADQGLAGKIDTTGDEVSWAFWLNSDGTLGFSASSDGGVVNTTDATSTAATGFTDGTRHALRVTLDVNNGASGNDTKFYTADTITGTWTQLGSTVTNSGTFSIFNSTADLVVGDAPEIIDENSDLIGGLRGRIRRFQMFSGLTGSDERADLDFSTQDAGDADITDEHSNTFELTDATVVDPSMRFSGEMTDLPQRWDSTGTDRWTPVEASGILRRLTQGDEPLHSAIYRAIIGQDPAPIAYWPCEDDSDATTVGSAISGIAPMRVFNGDPDFGSYDDFAGSDSLLVLNTAQYHGFIPPYTHTTKLQLRFVMNIPAAGETDGALLVNLLMTGGVHQARISYKTTGDLLVDILDFDGASLGTATLNANLDGDNVIVSLEFTQDGSDVDWAIQTLVVGDTGVVSTGGTLTSQTLGFAGLVSLNPHRTAETIAIGHVSVHTDIASLQTLADEIAGFAGETAARRIGRLCAEQGVPFRYVGDPDESTELGPQTSQSFVNLLREAEASDGGVLFEPRDMFGLAYRTRSSIYSQDATLTLDYDAADLSALEPTSDDQNTRNDITAKRSGGSSARYVLEDGPLSIQSPPDGVGRYDDEVTLSLFDDTGLLDQARWRVHLGTVDEDRYPEVGIQLQRSNFTGDATLTADAKTIDIGDRLAITNPPSWIPDDIDQIAQGFTERLGNFEYEITVNCSPGSPWRVGILDDDVLGRLDTDGSTLSSAATSTATSLSVATTNANSPLWTTTVAHFPFDIMVGGERITVTAISGSSSPQTFTVTRSVNGVVKAQSSGTAVSLAQPMILAL